MSKGAAQKARKGKAAVAQEPAPILLQQESASAALSRGDDSDDENEAAGAGRGEEDGGAAMPHADMFFSAQAPADADSAPAASSSEMAMLTQQLQLMQQIIMMQQQQMQQQLQQHKTELDETKKLLLGAASPSTAADAGGAPVETPSFTPFRTTVPALASQNQAEESEAAINTLRGRLGVVNDSIIAPSVRQDFNHLTEFQLGSRYVIKGLGLM